MAPFRSVPVCRPAGRPVSVTAGYAKFEGYDFTALTVLFLFPTTVCQPPLDRGDSIEVFQPTEASSIEVFQSMEANSVTVSIFPRQCVSRC